MIVLATTKRINPPTAFRAERASHRMPSRRIALRLGFSAETRWCQRQTVVRTGCRTAGPAVLENRIYRRTLFLLMPVSPSEKYAPRSIRVSREPVDQHCLPNEKAARQHRQPFLQGKIVPTEEIYRQNFLAKSYEP